MLIKMTVNLPYSWCQYCTRLDLRGIEFREEGNKSVTDHTCANASICEAAQKAKFTDEVVIKKHLNRIVINCPVSGCKANEQVSCCEECQNWTCRDRCIGTKDGCKIRRRKGNIEGKSID